MLTIMCVRLSSQVLVEVFVLVLICQSVVIPLTLTRVMIESTDSDGNRWSTVGVSANVIDASYNALHDAITFKLYRDGEKTK